MNWAGWADVIASGWWYGAYWVLVIEGTNDKYEMFWFDGPLSALVEMDRLEWGK